MRKALDDSGPVTVFPGTESPEKLREQLERFRRGHIRAVASLFLVDLGTTGILTILTRRWDAFLEALLCSIGVFGILGAIAAWWLSRRVVDSKGPELVALLKRLPARTAAQTAALALLYCYIAFNLGVYFPDVSRLDALPQSVKLGASAWFGAIYVLLYTSITYLVVADRCGRLRAWLQIHSGRFEQAGPGRFLLRVAPALFALAALPAALVGFDLGVFREVRVAQGLSVEQTVLLDSIASFFLIAIALYFVSRSLTRPVQLLAQAQKKLQDGDLRAASPVVSDDELGRLAAAFNRMVHGLRERKRLREAFERFTDAHVVEAAMRERQVPALAREATLLFTDVEGFTTIAEGLSPAETFQRMNDYIAVVAKVLREHGGTVNNFIGDAVMAVFNVPVELPAHARRAVEAALAVQTRLAERRARGEFAPRTRIGIATGMVHAGVIGDQGRNAYTVYGHAVNLAARLEQANRDFGTVILMAESTRTAAGGFGTERLEGQVTLRGLTKPVEAYSIGNR